MKASRAFFFEAQQKFGSMPFSLRHFDDEIKAKVGSTECVKHDLLQPYEVLGNVLKYKILFQSSK